MAQDKWVERMRQRQDAVARRHRQEFGLAVCDPLDLGQGLARGTVAIAARMRGVPLKATVRTLFGVPAELGGAADSKSVEDLVSGRRHRRGSTIRRAIEAEDVRDFPLGDAALRPLCWVAAGWYWGQGPTPPERAAGCRHARDRRGYGCWRGACD